MVLELPRPSRLQWLCLLAALTFLPTLSLQYTGEESVYTLLAYEQWHAGRWLSATQLGAFYSRPPLFNWLIVAMSSLLGWPHALIAARCVSALATLATGLVVVGVARRMGADRGQGWFAGLLFLTLWEPLFYYGWLAYSDALMGFCVSTAMACAWLAVREDRPSWLAGAWLLALLGFLTKALTAYVFVGLALGVCVWRYRALRRMLRPAMLAACLPVLLAPLWLSLTAAGRGELAHGMAQDIVAKLGWLGFGPWVTHALNFAFHTVINLMPASGVLLWLAWRQRSAHGPDAWQAVAVASVSSPAVKSEPSANPGLSDREAITGLLIVLVNVLPYCLAPQSSTRYLMPIYGIAALGMAPLIWQQPTARRWALRAITFTLILKAVLAVWLFPEYTRRVRPDIAAIAADVTQRSAGYPLYVGSTTWIELSVAATLDLTPDAQGQLRTPLVMAPPDWSDAWVIAAPATVVGERLVHLYGERDLALICRGRACPP